MFCISDQKQFIQPDASTNIEKRFLCCQAFCELLAPYCHDLIIVIDGEGVINYISQSAENVLGYNCSELTSRNLLEYVHPYDALQIQPANMENNLEKRSRIDIRISHKNGLWVYLETMVYPLAGCKSINKVLLVSRDITERRNLEQTLIKGSLCDQLTGLANREIFVEQTKISLAYVNKQGLGQLAVMFIGLDRFKLINESLGHGAGDEVLKAVANRLKEAKRPGDSIARFGEDKFALLIDNITEKNEIMQMVNQLRDVLARPFYIIGQQVFVNASFGIAEGSGDYECADDIIRDADIALYEAKQNNRGSYSVFQNHMHQDAVKRLQTESDIRSAIEKKEFVLHYLPIVSLKTGEIVGVEALVRWRRSSGQLVYPDAFIGVAEETGLITPLGNWVLEDACKQLNLWNRMGFTSVRMAVNFSADQFRIVHLAKLVLGTLKTNNINPTDFEMEITERLVMQYTVKNQETLQELRLAGINISIDDFGTGYSSLSYLKRLRSHVLKVDKSFIQDITQDTDALIIVKTIILMAHSLGIKVLAEGVETREQLALLISLECEEMQGFYFSRPLPADEMTKLLESGRGLSIENF